MWLDRAQHLILRQLLEVLVLLYVYCPFFVLENLNIAKIYVEFGLRNLDDCVEDKDGVLQRGGFLEEL